jgi:iron-sulfur cluster repair protein YtfE (RIC family)
MAREDAGSAACTLHALIATILHHSYLKRELPALEGLLRRSIRQDSGVFRVLAGQLLPLFLRFRRELEAHMRREEVTLFPLIERLELAIAESRPALATRLGLSAMRSSS